MAEGGEGEQDDVSFLRTVNSLKKTLSCTEKCMIFFVNFCRKTWCVFRALTLENVSACLLKDLEIGTVSWKELLIG